MRILSKHKRVSALWVLAFELTLFASAAWAADPEHGHDDAGHSDTSHADHGDDSHGDDAHGGEAHGDDHGGGQPNILSGDIGNVFWTLVIFGTLLFVLSKAAWKPILGALQKREEFIERSLRDAKREREEAEAKLREYTQQVEKAREEATAIVEEGRRDAEVVRRQIQDEARKEADTMVERAKREIDIARDTAVKDLYDLVADMSTDVAGRIIKRQLSPDEHRRLVQESIDELKQMSGQN